MPEGKGRTPGVLREARGVQELGSQPVEGAGSVGNLSLCGLELEPGQVDGGVVGELAERDALKGPLPDRDEACEAVLAEGAPGREGGGGDAGGGRGRGRRRLLGGSEERLGGGGGREERRGRQLLLKDGCRHLCLRGPKGGHRGVEAGRRGVVGLGRREGRRACQQRGGQGGCCRWVGLRRERLPDEGDVRGEVSEAQEATLLKDGGPKGEVHVEVRDDEDLQVGNDEL